MCVSPAENDSVYVAVFLKANSSDRNMQRFHYLFIFYSKKVSAPGVEDLHVHVSNRYDLSV